MAKELQRAGIKVSKVPKKMYPYKVPQHRGCYICMRRTSLHSITDNTPPSGDLSSRHPWSEDEETPNTHYAFDTCTHARSSPRNMRMRDCRWWDGILRHSAPRYREARLGHQVQGTPLFFATEWLSTATAASAGAETKGRSANVVMLSRGRADVAIARWPIRWTKGIFMVAAGHRKRV